MAHSKPTSRNPWAWVSSLYLAEGLPYVVVMTVAAIMYKGLGVSNTDIALYTAWLYLPWVIKPFWSPVVDILKTRRSWIWAMELLLGGGLAGVALTIPLPGFFQYSLAFFWLLAFSSATHDIAIDGFYLLATTEKEQSFFVGIRTTFYRLAMIAGQGLLVMFAGAVQDHTGLPKLELAVSARTGVAQMVALPQFPVAGQPADGPLRAVLSPGTLEIAPEARPKAEIAALVALAKTNNLLHGFCPPERKLADAGATKGWWQAPLTALESAVRRTFGEAQKPKSATVGNIGLVSLRLSRPPGREVVLVLAAKVGFGIGGGDDKSFSIVEGSRLIFNDTNWNQPALAVIQLDPKLRGAAATALELRSGNIPLSWTVTFLAVAGVFLFFAVYHRFILPYPVADKPGDARTVAAILREFFQTFGAFFGKNQIGRLLLFLLGYRFAEAQLVRLAPLFLQDAREAGGLGLTTGQLGFAYGTVGILALTCGGLLGGLVVAKRGLRFWLWWMVLAIHLPDAVFVYLSYAQPDNFWIINGCVAVEQFGYGFGFTAYMLYMIYIARGRHATAHYAICTGFMALGMMVPGMFSGWLEDLIGYRHFFIWVMLATIPGFLVAKLIPLDAEFGSKDAAAKN